MILGVEMHGSPLSVSSFEILRGKTVTGSYFGGVKAKSDIPFFVKKYLHNVSSEDYFMVIQYSYLTQRANIVKAK